MEGKDTISAWEIPLRKGHLPYSYDNVKTARGQWLYK